LQSAATPAKVRAMSNTSKKTTSKIAPARRARRTGAPEGSTIDVGQTEAATATATAATVSQAPVAATVRPPAPSRHQIAQLAYRYFEESGFAHGHALEHWLRAEAELIQRR
jgi:hypothetical protein